MSKEICVIKTEAPVYFPHSFFGGRMSNYVVVLNYSPHETHLMGLEYCPHTYKKKPTASCWLGLQIPLMAASFSPFDFCGHFEIILRAKVSDKKYQEYVKYWIENVHNGTTKTSTR